MNIPFRIKLLTSTARAPHRNCESDLWDIFADGFLNAEEQESYTLEPQKRVLVKTGISLELPKQINNHWHFEDDISSLCKTHYKECQPRIEAYAVADLRPRSGLALKHGITVLNAPATIDNSYRKEIGVILINNGHEPYTIRKDDKIAQMLIRPLYPSKMEIVKEIEDTNRGGYGSTGN